MRGRDHASATGTGRAERSTPVPLPNARCRTESPWTRASSRPEVEGLDPASARRVHSTISARSSRFRCQHISSSTSTVPNSRYCRERRPRSGIPPWNRCLLRSTRHSGSRCWRYSTVRGSRCGNNISASQQLHATRSSTDGAGRHVGDTCSLRVARRRKGRAADLAPPRVSSLAHTGVVA